MRKILSLSRRAKRSAANITALFAPNAASCRVLEKNGFAKEGIKRKSVFKNGAFYDSIVYARIKE